MNFLKTLKSKVAPYVAAAALTLGGTVVANNACTHYNFSSGSFGKEITAVDEIKPALEKALPELKKEGIANTLEEAIREIDTVSINKTGKNPKSVYSGIISLGFDYGNGTAIFTDEKGNIVRANPNGQFVISIPFKADTPEERNVIEELTSSCGLEKLNYTPLDSKTNKDLEQIYTAIEDLTIQIQNLTGKVDYIAYNPAQSEVLEIVTDNRKILLDLTNRYSLLETKVDEGLKKLGLVTDRTDEIKKAIENIYNTTLEIYDLTKKTNIAVTNLEENVGDLNIRTTNLEERVTNLEEKGKQKTETNTTLSLGLYGLWGNNSSEGSNSASGFGFGGDVDLKINYGKLTFSGGVSYSSNGLTSKETVPVQSISGTAEGEITLQEGSTSTTTFSILGGYKFGDTIFSVGGFYDLLEQNMIASDYKVKVNGSTFGPMVKLSYAPEEGVQAEAYAGVSLGGNVHQKLTFLGTSTGNNGTLSVLKLGGKIAVPVVKAGNGQLYIVGRIDFQEPASTYTGALGEHSVSDLKIGAGLGYKF